MIMAAKKTTTTTKNTRGGMMPACPRCMTKALENGAKRGANCTRGTACAEHPHVQALAMVSSAG